VGTTPGNQPPRFPGFDVAGQARTWDQHTVRVVLSRLAPGEGPGFFTAEEEPTVRALLDRLLAQDAEPRVPVFELIDARLAKRAGDGYRYADLPEDPETWRASIAGLDADAEDRHGRRFCDVGQGEQLRHIEAVRQTEGTWHGLPGQRTFSLWVRYACAAFYSHPWAWNEIGFGGPAYPRGYKNLGLDRREPWEVEERHPTDPVPWAQRADAARRRHADALSSSGPDGRQRTEERRP
jgi:hypothetical protein